MQSDQPFYGPSLARAHAQGFAGLWDGAAQWLATLARAGPRKPFVVDIGCGDGRMLDALSRHGIPGSGVERSADFATMARARGFDVELADAATARLPDASLVIALGEVLAYENTMRECALVPVIGRAASCLGTGGILVFDLPGPDIRQGQSWRQGPDWFVASTTTTDKDRLTREIVSFHKNGSRWYRSAETHIQRMWPQDEIEALLNKAGFTVQVTDRFGTVTLLPGRIGFVARIP